MKEITDKVEAVRAAGKKWCDLLSRHSVARYAMDEDRNEVAGRVFEARKVFEALLDDLCIIAQESEDAAGFALR